MINCFGSTIPFQDVIEQLKKEVHLKTICKKIICQHIVSQAAQSRNLTLTDEEIQAETDRIRYESRLESAAATFAWLDDQLITPEDWEAGIRDRLLAQKLAEHLFGHEVETCFAQNKVDYENVVLYRLVVAQKPLAQEIFYQIEAQEISFYEAAHFYDIDEQQRLLCGYQGTFSRWKLNPDIAAHVFSARPKQVMGPFPTGPHYELLMVENILPAVLTSDIRQTILNRMFQDWLEQEVNYIMHHTR